MALVGEVVPEGGNVERAGCNAPLGSQFSDLPLAAVLSQDASVRVVVSVLVSGAGEVAGSRVGVREQVGDRRAIPDAGVCEIVGGVVPFVEAVRAAHPGQRLGVEAGGAVPDAGVVDGVAEGAGRALLDARPSGVVSEEGLRAKVSAELGDRVSVLAVGAVLFAFVGQDIPIGEVGGGGALPHAGLRDVV